MNTPAHLLVGALAFGRPNQPWTRAAALAGSLAPDLSLYLMAGVSLLLLDISPQVVFNELYFSAAWQRVFSIDNSIVLWGLGLGFAVWRRHAIGLAFAGAGLLHLGFDFLLHNDDARAHLWPITEWRFISPLSYWDSNHHANIVAPVLAVVAVVVGMHLLRRDTGWGWRVLWLVLMGFELFTLRNWLMFF